MRLAWLLLVAAAQHNNLRTAPAVEIALESTETAPEDRLAYYESKARESFHDFRGKVDTYVSNFNDNEFVNSITRQVRGFYKWATNRDKWEAAAILLITAVLLYTAIMMIVKLIMTVCNVVCLPVRCLTCCCRRRHRSYYR